MESLMLSTLPNQLTAMHIRLLCLLLFCSCTARTIHINMDVPPALQDQLKATTMAGETLPADFRNGFLLLNRRDDPGMIYLVNAGGRIVWYHQVQGTGFKTAHLTAQQTFLCILGDKTFPTSYGDEILEIGLQGDTVLHLKKGQRDFLDDVHHEVLRKGADEIVALTSVQKIVDLSLQGGGEQDTVKSDGIVVYDREGRRRWQWSVFDALEPTADTAILRTRHDWMHANSLSFDKDSNYLVSFYNNGQIWKVNAQSGKVMWKFGSGGDFAIPDSAAFDMGHAVHINTGNELMLFDNGVSRQQSQTLAFRLNDSTRQAILTMKTVLPPYLFNERMGSAYLAGHDHVVQCCSKRNTVILTTRNGHPLWTLRTTFIPYRAEFIAPSQLLPYVIAE
ncbi:aryl-sulfate sulfotransferase [Chitinophaga oryzae]|uniref:Aryl-sulfate sulfotransferase n=1 Tax=Chitinophaga oryzae TaxID=2725414 RepID=A0AAE6ZFI5_9BACT|nr:aryl-sulfate sulfotransferase [Chitinophaga oryzae]QJB32060.1 aryl-sulfate sulfotransferase [Chitinophaga oryzae]QJB38537.1 aryl-sulfate sulfotransferase [Chitinophaga oryzae]